MKNLVLCLGLIGMGLNGVNAAREASVAVASVNAQDGNGASCVGTLSSADQDLFSAAKAGDLEAVNNAIAAGARVNAQDDRGYKPLDYCLATMHNMDIYFAEHADLYHALRARNKHTEVDTESRIMDFFEGLFWNYCRCAGALTREQRLELLQFL